MYILGIYNLAIYLYNSHLNSKLIVLDSYQEKDNILLNAQENCLRKLKFQCTIGNFSFLQLITLNCAE